MKLITLLLVVLFVSTGCRLTSVEGETNDVEIKVKSKDHNDDDKDYSGDKSDGKFCPPGQAKKGRC
ncbi:hypothetical protein LRP50_15985 [Enterovibrio sp. ZSDZ42]|uniref:Lipoprotein n=1 Tax=Enterovibrio gelatinilyticus TaxID=2899819 RepID=A0ABT5R312_9GAMM|nr:hypothetical protein [Enterovibrio sp. ZSDZ42]MDD1794634.1 hypothetical protein [Enterovibrio sp. ZSDZ42]